MNEFQSYIKASVESKTLTEKFHLAVAMGFVDADLDAWIVEDICPEFEICDFIVSGGFPGFSTKRDAVIAHDLMIQSGETGFEVDYNTHEGILYWYLD